MGYGGCKLLHAEAFCHAAGVSPYRVLELITVVAVRQGAPASAIVAAVTCTAVRIQRQASANRDKQTGRYRITAFGSFSFRLGIHSNDGTKAV